MYAVKQANLLSIFFINFFIKSTNGAGAKDYDRIFGSAGYKISKKIKQSAIFGFAGTFNDSNFVIGSIEQDSPAAANLQIGDVITKINNGEVRSAIFGDLAGKKIELTITRENKERTVSMNVGSRDELSYVLSENGLATAEQLKIRAGWLER